MHKESDPMANKDDDDARRKGKQPLVEDDEDQDQAAVTAYITRTTPPSDPSCSASATNGLDRGTSSTTRAPIKFHHGYHFAPRDDELIRFYLDAKLSGLKLPLDVFNDVQLYDHNPKDLVDIYKEWGEDRWFFFTPIVRKYPNGSRPNRTTKDGFWKATGSDKPIKYKGSVIGLRKSLVYYEKKPPNVIKTEWVMYEYNKTNTNNNHHKGSDKKKLDDWVLCSIQMTRGALIKQHKKRKLDQVHEETAPQSACDGLMDDFTERLNLHQVHGESSDPALQSPDGNLMIGFPQLFNSVSDYPDGQDNQNNDDGTLEQLLQGYYELDTLDNQHSSCGIMEVVCDIGINDGYWFHEIAPNEQLQQSFTPDQLMLHSSTLIDNDPLMVNGDDFYGQFAPHQQISSMEGQINNGDELYSVVAPYQQMPQFMAQPANEDEFNRGVYPHQQMSSMVGEVNNEDGLYGGVATNQQMPDSSTTPANQQKSFMMAGTTIENRIFGEALNDTEHGSSEYDHPRHGCQMPQFMVQPANEDEFNRGVYPHQQMSSMVGEVNNEDELYGGVTGVATNQQMPNSSTTPANQQKSFMMAGTTNENRISGEALNDTEHGSSEYDHPRHGSPEHGSH